MYLRPAVELERQQKLLKEMQDVEHRKREEAARVLQQKEEAATAVAAQQAQREKAAAAAREELRAGLAGEAVPKTGAMTMSMQKSDDNYDISSLKSNETTDDEVQPSHVLQAAFHALHQLCTQSAEDGAC